MLTAHRAVWRYEHIDFGSLLKRPKLLPHHIKKRFEWARRHRFLPFEECKRVIFTDEKRFCLDGPDGNTCYWRDTRLPRDIFATRARWGGGV